MSKTTKTINVGGRQLPMRVTMGAMLRFKRATGHDVKALKSDDIEELIIFLHCCVTSACKADGVAEVPELEEFADALEPDALQEFYGALGVDAEVSKKTAPPTEIAPTEA